MPSCLLPAFSVDYFFDKGGEHKSSVRLLSHVPVEKNLTGCF